MPTIVNPIRSNNPLGQALSQLGEQMFGDTLTPALKREKLLGMQRENVETGNLADLFAQGGAPGVNDVLRHGVLAGRSGSDLGNLYRTFGANTFGAEDPRTTNAMLGAGDSFSSTPQGFDKSLGETQRQFDQKPVEALVGGEPAFVPQSGAFGEGVSPILSNTDRQGTLAGQNFGNMGALPPEEQSYLGAEPRSPGTPRNYIAGGRSFITFDGVTDAQTGEPLPPGGYIGSVEGSAEDTGLRPDVESQLQKDNLSLDNFSALADMGEELLANPMNFGPTGKIRALGQDVVASLNNLAQGMGSANFNEAVQNAKADMAAAGGPNLIPEFYDTDLPSIQTVWGLLLYSGAAALAGQEGRSISDKDIAIMRQTLGDPHSLLTSREGVAAKLDIARQLVDDRRRRNTETLGGGMPPAERPDDPMAGGQGADSGATKVFERGPDGQLQRVQ